MARRTGRERAVTVALAALVVAGTWAVLAGATTVGAGTAGAGMAGAGTAGQETTTTADEGSVAVQNLSAPEQIRIGTSYQVSATLVNQDDQQTVVQVNYRIVGNVLASRLVTLPGDATQTVQFDVSSNDTEGLPAGTYTHGVFAGGDNATAELSLVDSATTATPAETATAIPEQTTTATPAETTPATETATATRTTAQTTTPAETTRADETPSQANESASLTFERQSSNGTTVTVRSVNVSEGGFVVIHNTDVVEGEVVDSIVGVSEYLDAGAHENVTVRLDDPLDQSQRVVAIAYRDTNGNQEYDFVDSNRTADGPYTEPDSREAVNAIAVVNVTDEGGTSTATTNETD